MGVAENGKNSVWSGRGLVDPEKSGWVGPCFRNLHSLSPLPYRPVRPSLERLVSFLSMGPGHQPLL